MTIGSTANSRTFAPRWTALNGRRWLRTAGPIHPSSVVRRIGLTALPVGTVQPMTGESTGNDRVLAGRCECGAVRYQVADAFRYAANCHCSRCRAATGSAFKPFAGIERGKLEVTRGGETLLVHGEETLNDTRCAACGSLLFSVVRDGA